MSRRSKRRGVTVAEANGAAPGATHLDAFARGIAEAANAAATMPRDGAFAVMQHVGPVFTGDIGDTHVRGVHRMQELSLPQHDAAVAIAQGMRFVRWAR